MVYIKVLKPIRRIPRKGMSPKINNSLGILTLGSSKKIRVGETAPVVVELYYAHRKMLHELQKAGYITIGKAPEKAETPVVKEKVAVSTPEPVSAQEVAVEASTEASSADIVDAYTEMSSSELKSLCEERDISVKKGMNKAQMREALREADAR